MPKLKDGGWCHLHHSHNVALNKMVAGRLLLYNKELSFLERFDVQTDRLDGYFVILNRTKQRIKKANWIKKMLVIGGKIVPDGKLPEALYAETLNEFFSKLQSSKEVYDVNLNGEKITGRTFSFSDLDVIIETSSNNKITGKTKVDLTDIVCLEFRIQKLRKLTKQ
ncbi:MAG: hypothetical protein IT249_11785 [Chitinophagaceae bacterium]|nr:hypothetical protein [Chitinophagaceae bacterium]